MDKNKGLREIVSGTMWLFMSLIGGRILEYINRIIIARFYGPADYGLIIFLLTFSMVVMAFSLLGLHIGASRFIAFFKGKGESEKIRKVVFWGLKAVFVSGMFFTVISFIFRRYIVLYFVKRDIPPALIIIFILIIPVWAMAEFLYSCLRGMKLPKYATLSKEAIRRIFTILAVIISLFIGHNLNYIAFAYLIGFVAFLLAVFIWVEKFAPTSNASSVNFSEKYFFLFSLPLVFSFILKQMSGRIGIFFIGFFRDTTEIGFYSAALSFARLISLPLTLVMFMFVPVISGLWANKNQAEIKNIFYTVTKWIFIPSSFLLIIFLIFPNSIIIHTFGPKFESAYKALWIISLGHFFYSLCGLGGSLLIAFGETKKYFLGDLCGILISLALGPFLVKNFGFIGAAYIVLIRLVIINIIWAIFAYKISKLIFINVNVVLCLLSIGVFVTLLKTVIKIENVLFQAGYAIALFVLIIVLLRFSIKNQGKLLFNLLFKSKKG